MTRLQDIVWLKLGLRTVSASQPWLKCPDGLQLDELGGPLSHDASWETPYPTQLHWEVYAGCT